MFNSSWYLSLLSVFGIIYRTSGGSSKQTQHHDHAEGDAQTQGVRDETNDWWPDQKAHISTGGDRGNSRPRSLLRGATRSTQREGEHHRKSRANQAKPQERDRNPDDQ